jgi:hypothetical protein
MRIAFLPLDSRPANWQFPQRLATIAGVDLLLPPREWLGTLNTSARSQDLLGWLVRMASDCDAAIFSFDALVYGGLIQSRELKSMRLGSASSAAPECLKVISAELERIDWNRCAGYALATVPRLGISVRDNDSHNIHQLVREYFITHGAASKSAKSATVAQRLEQELGSETITTLWHWRERNAAVCGGLLDLSCRLGLRLLHFSVEDNAPTGPHLAEASALRQRATLLRSDYPDTQVTLFDGTDEAQCLLLARAVHDFRKNSSLPVQLLLHPRSPGPDKYIGLYESQPLGAGLDFLARLLDFDYRHQADQRWLVCYGKQPQPDVFSDDPDRIFNNPFLLPKGIDPGGPLLLTDLCACNGANPNLAGQIARHTMQQRSSMLGLCGFNTNFNALGVSAAWLSLIRKADDTIATPYSTDSGTASVCTEASRNFALERLADDLVYQSIARPRLLTYLKQRGVSPLDFSTVDRSIHDEAVRLVERYWRDWCRGQGSVLLEACGIETKRAEALCFSFPWQRAFECQADAPTL